MNTRNIFVMKCDLYLFCRALPRVKSTEVCTNSYFGFIRPIAKRIAGSPLILQKKNSDLLIGLSSSRFSYYPFTSPIFTRISSFIKWIDENMRNATTITTRSTISNVAVTQTGAAAPVTSTETSSTTGNDITAETTIPTTTSMQSTQEGN